MPLTSVNGYNAPVGRDLHLLRGLPAPSLASFLSVSWIDPDDPDNPATGTYDNYPQPAGDPDVVLEFRPLFNLTETADLFTGFGIEINKASGAMTVGAWPLGQPAPANFLVEVTVMSNGGEPRPLMLQALIRVHIHRSVTQIWMTPPRLSIHRPTATGLCNTSYAFTVRAQFDDDVVGDISNTDYFAPDPVDEDYFHDNIWVTIPANMTVGTVRTLTLVTTPAWGSLYAHGDIEILEPWATAPNIPQAELIDGRAEVWDGTLKPENVANILFVGVGYRATDGDAFQEFTNIIVQHLRTDERFSPYRYLSNSMNYWRVFIPAGDPGVSVRCEVYPFLDDGKLYAVSVPGGVGPIGAAKWNLANLVFMAGLPIAADQALVLVDATKPTGFDFTKLKQKWDLTIATFPPRNVDDDVIVDWMKLAKRTFIDEVDNFPNISVGVPPVANADDTGEMNFHFQRGGGDTGATERAAFYSRITALPRDGFVTTVDDNGTDGPNLGNLWGDDRISFKFDNRQFVVVLSNMPTGDVERFFGRSQWIEDRGIITRPTAMWANTQLNMPGLPVATVVGRNALTLTSPDAAKTELADDTWETIAHELGHAFGLGDEYGHDAESFVGTNAEFDSDPNLMAYSAAIKADQTADPTILVNQLKWNWPRIKKASVLTLPIEDMVTGTYRVFVAKGRGFQFLPGDTVLFRNRDPRVAITANPVTSFEEFVVDSVHAENLSNPADPVNMTVVVRNGGIGIDLSGFKVDDIIFEPIPAVIPVYTISHPYLTMVPPVSERIMAAIGGAMSGTVCDIHNFAKNKERVQVPNLPPEQLATFAPATALPDLIGAYYGGSSEYSCGVIHPAGSCFMRSTRDNTTHFCAVCQYLLVDKLDPELHWNVDRDYDAKYLL